MNKKRTILGGAILVAVLMLGIGYAAIDAITLNISGTATANENADNFVVKFDNATDKTTATAGVTAKVTADKTATMDVTGLTAKGDEATATFTIVNESEDLSAQLAVNATATKITNDTDGYFSVSAVVNNPTLLTAKGSTTATVTVTLNKTPVDGAKTGTINVQLDATPVQPTN